MIAVLRCWIHENQRVFGDRLINNEDKNWLRAQLLERCLAVFQATEEQLFINDRILFGDFMGTVRWRRAFVRACGDFTRGIHRLRDRRNGVSAADAA